MEEKGSESREKGQCRWHGQPLNLMKSVSLWRTWGGDKVSMGLGIMRGASYGGGRGPWVLLTQSHGAPSDSAMSTQL